MQIKVKYHFTPLSLEMWESLDIWNLGKEHPLLWVGWLVQPSQEAASDWERVFLATLQSHSWANAWEHRDAPHTTVTVERKDKPLLF